MCVCVCVCVCGCVCVWVCVCVRERERERERERVIDYIACNTVIFSDHVSNVLSTRYSSILMIRLIVSVTVNIDYKQ